MPEYCPNCEMNAARAAAAEADVESLQEALETKQTVLMQRSAEVDALTSVVAAQHQEAQVLRNRLMEAEGRIVARDKTIREMEHSLNPCGDMAQMEGE